MYLKITLTIDEENPNAKIRCFTELSGGNLKHYIWTHKLYIEELEKMTKELKIVLAEFIQRKKEMAKLKLDKSLKENKWK